MSEPSSRNSAALLVSACVVVGIVTYAPAVSGSYGRLDDYGYVFASRTGGLDYTRQFLIDSGRPVTAFFMTVMAPPVHSVEGLWLLRLASTVALALGAGTAALLMLRLADRPWRASAFVLAVCTGGVALSTTAAPSAATWAILAGGLLAFPAAMTAGLLATTSWRGWWAAAGVLVMVAVFAYQQVAPIAVLPTMLWTAQRWARHEPPMWWRTVVISVMTVAGLLANLVFVRQRDSVAMSRITDATASERVTWFTDEFLPRTVDLLLLPTDRSLTWSIVLLATLLLFPILTGARFLAGSAAVLLAWAGTALVVLPLELWASFRLAAPSQFVLWAGSAVVFSLAVLRLSRKSIRTAMVVAAVSATVVSLAVAGLRAEKYLAEPNERDWAAVQCAVERRGELAPGTTIQLNPFDVANSPVTAMDEYGIVSSSVGWAVQPAVWLAEAETSRADPVVQPNELTVRPVGEETRGALTIPVPGEC
jgi:MFS family permease